MPGRRSSCPDAVRLWKYAHGKLSTAEQFEVEHHALDCPLCAAAVEGFASVEQLPELESGRTGFFDKKNRWWTIAGISLALIGILWSGGLFRNAQQQPASPEPGPSDDISAMNPPADHQQSAPSISDSVTVVNIRKAVTSEVSVERRRRWGDELFMIEKRGVENVPVGSVKTGVKGRSKMDVVYIEGLKVAAYKDRLEGSGVELEVARNLHPRYANDREPQQESFYSDTDTILYRDLLTDALRAFNFGLCQQVMGQLKSISDRFPDDQNVAFYSGMCAKLNGQYADAISFFSKMSSDETSPFHEEAMWHSALCYEQAGDTSNAMKFFRRIAEGEGFYADAAAKKL